MCVAFEKQRLVLLILFLRLNFVDTQLNENDFRPSNIELIPDFVILNSSGTADFLCINHQFDNLPLMINLSKSIPNHQIEIFRYEFNQTTLYIRIQLKNYLGIFHLFCYSKDKMNKGTRADIIVKTEPEAIALTKKCQVYSRQFIQCTFRAPTIVRAIRNDFPAQFEFSEETNSGAYQSRYIFVKNESLKDDLVFNWIPMFDKQFPDGVVMNMSIHIPYFSSIIYRFDMSPNFVVRPDFTLKIFEESQIEIRLKSLLPTAMCVKRITPQLKLNDVQWTSFDSRQIVTHLDRFKFDTYYRVCIRCRERSNDSYNIATCQTIKTPTKLYCHRIIIIIISVTCGIFLVLTGGVFYYFYRNRSTIEPPPADELDDIGIDELIDSDQEKYKPLDLIQDSLINENRPKYQSMYD